MLEIIVVSICLVALIVLLKVRRKGGRLWVPRMSESLATGALAVNTVTGTNFANSFRREAYVISGDFTATMHGHTAGEGPIVVGLAHSDYSDAEIEEWLEANGSWDISDKIAQEHARRKCRILGTFSGVGVTETLNDGKPFRKKIGFTVESEHTLKLWAYNESGTQLTTGTIIELKGPLYCKPV